LKYHGRVHTAPGPVVTTVAINVSLFPIWANRCDTTGLNWWVS